MFLFKKNVIALSDFIKKMPKYRQEYQNKINLLDLKKDKKGFSEYVKSVRDEFYGLDLEEFEIDKLWEYMNLDVEYFILFCVFGKGIKDKKCIKKRSQH